MGNSVKSLKIFTKKVRSARRLFTLWIPWMLLHVWLPDLTESFLTGPVLTEPCAADWVFTNKLSWTVASCVLCGTDTGEDFEIKPASPVVVSAGVRPTPELTVLITVWDFCDLSSPQTHSAWNLRKSTERSAALIRHLHRNVCLCRYESLLCSWCMVALPKNKHFSLLHRSQGSWLSLLLLDPRIWIMPPNFRVC